MAKIEKNHSYKEYEKKYGKMQKSGKLYNIKEKDIYSSKKPSEKMGLASKFKFKHRKYWKIDDNYYQVPTFFEKIKYSSRRTKALICVGAVVLVGAVAVTSVGIIHVLNNYSVTLESNTIKLDNYKAKKLTEYTTTMEITDSSKNTFPNKDDIHIEIGGKKFEDFKLEDVAHEYNKKKLVIPSNCVTGNIHISTNATYHGFADDSWSTIINLLNDGGSKALKKHYGVNTLVGEKHTVALTNGKTPIVTIIGENQDHLYSDYYSSASITLAFLDSPEDIIETSTTYYTENPCRSYAGSNIQKCSNNLINKIESTDLKDSINEVAKYTVYNDSSWGNTYDVSKDKIFPLSLREMGGLDCYTTISDKKIKQSDFGDVYACENPCYSFFDKSKSFNFTNIYGDKLILTRSPYLGDSDYKAFAFKNYDTKSSCFHAENMTSGSGYFIPAFTLGVESSFEYDTWDNVIAYANQGLNKLQEVYGIDSFIGKEKNIIIGDDKIYTVRVIGENHDVISDSEDKLAALTFEFTSSPLSSCLHDGTSGATSSWSTSKARSDLNDVEVSTSFINSMPKNIKDNLKTVTKYSALYGKHEEHTIPEVEQTDDKLFVLSYKELGALDYNVSKNAEKPESKLLNKEPYAIEGDTYQYYINQIKSYDFDDKDTEYKNYGSSIRANGNSDQSYSLLRSSDPSDVYKSIVIHCTDGSDEDSNWAAGEADSKLKDTTCLLKPCFCIGESSSTSNNVFEFDTWENLINNADQGIDKLKEAYNLNDEKDFIGKTRSIKLNTEDGIKEFKVRVIGVNADTLYDDTSKKAALTFEFTRCIVSSISYNDNESGDNEWYTSSLRNECNTKYFYQLPAEVQKGIKKVQKVTDSKYGNKTTPEKMFPLSMYEIGEQSSADKPCYDYYNFYNKEWDPESFNKEHLVAERIKADCKYDSYHLRTPSNVGKTVENLIYYINNGYVLNNLSVTSTLGLAPAFAI